MTTWPALAPSACSSLNSVGVSPTETPSTYAWTLRGIDQQLLEVERVAARGSRSGHAAPGRDSNARDELGHRQRLDEVVVGSELERTNAVLLRAASADDDDRRADSFAADRLDDAPAVDAGQHQVEHADVRLSVAKARQAGLALVDDGRLEPGQREMLRHAAADDGVVFDDENAGHDVPSAIIETRCPERGTGMVREW